MKKKLLLLSPLFLSVVLPHNVLNGMDATAILDRHQAAKRRQELQYPSIDEMLNEIRQHRVFREIQNKTQNFDTEVFVTDLILDPNFTNADSSSSSDFSLEQQEELNLMVSGIMNGTIPTTEEVKSETPQTSGLSWDLYLKSYTYSPTDLLCYAIPNDMFEPNNTDHQALLNKAITQCIDKQDSKKLIEVLQLVEKKHMGKIILPNHLSEAAHDYLVKHQTTQHATLRTNFEQLSDKTIITCTAAMKKLEEELETTLRNILAAQNNFNTSQKELQKEFRSYSNQHKQAESLLRKLSNSEIIPQSENMSWAMLIETNKQTSSTNTFSIDGIQQSRRMIKDLSAQLENKK